MARIESADGAAGRSRADASPHPLPASPAAITVATALPAATRSQRPRKNADALDDPRLCLRALSVSPVSNLARPQRRFTRATNSFRRHLQALVLGRRLDLSSETIHVLPLRGEAVSGSLRDQAAQCGLPVNLPSACGSKPCASAGGRTLAVLLENLDGFSKPCGNTGVACRVRGLRAESHLRARFVDRTRR